MRILAYFCEYAEFGLNLSAVSGYFPQFSAVNGYGLLRNHYGYGYGYGRQNCSVNGWDIEHRTMDPPASRSDMNSCACK